MKHTYMINFAPTRSHPKRAFIELARRFTGVHFESGGEFTTSANEEVSRALFAEARARGFTCSFEVATEYGYDDARAADLGILTLGPAGTTRFCAPLPKDAFDFATGCPGCGLGAAQIKPRVMASQSIGCRGNFYPSGTGSKAQGDHSVLLRAEIGREIVRATRQPWCMRHPVTRTGKVVEEWLEPVPCATMPPLSAKSEGVLLGRTTALSEIGEGPREVPPCPVCGRMVWSEAYDVPTRLVYSRAAMQAAQEHAVVVMHEPKDCFPGLDPVKRTFSDLYGLPWLMFNRNAVEVILKYTQREHVRDSAYIRPVFSE